MAGLLLKYSLFSVISGVVSFQPLQYNVICSVACRMIVE